MTSCSRSLGSACQEQCESDPDLEAKMQRPERRHRLVSQRACNNPAAIHISNNNEQCKGVWCSVCAAAYIINRNHKHNKRSYCVSTSAFEQYLSYLTQNEDEQWEAATFINTHVCWRSIDVPEF